MRLSTNQRAVSPSGNSSGFSTYCSAGRRRSMPSSVMAQNMEASSGDTRPNARARRTSRDRMPPRSARSRASASVAQPAASKTAPASPAPAAAAPPAVPQEQRHLVADVLLVRRPGRTTRRLSTRTWSRNKAVHQGGARGRGPHAARSSTRLLTATTQLPAGKRRVHLRRAPGAVGKTPCAPRSDRPGARRETDRTARVSPAAARAADRRPTARR